MKNQALKNDFKIADITKQDELAIKHAEDLIKKETGKDFVMIAWEKELH